MADILNYKFYLNFKNVDSFGRIEITEPIGFDGASFVISQDSKRYGRDAYKINEEINLNFYKGSFDAASTAQQLPNGTIIYNLTQGFDWIMDVYNQFGFEANVDFEIELGDVLFIPSNLDFQTSETDGYTYFSCKALQESSRQQIKRRSDIVTDIFSTEDLDGNIVTPAQTESILLKAKPLKQSSKWNTPNTFYDIGSGGIQETWYFNAINNTIEDGIANTLSYFGGLETTAKNFNYINAQDDLTNVIIKAENISFDIGLSNGNFIGSTAVYYRIGSLYSESDEILLKDLGNGLPSIDFTREYRNQFFELTTQIQRGQKIWIYFKFKQGSPVIILSFYEGEVTATATSTAIDSVIKGVRYIDVFKENVKRINGFTVDAERYDIDGEYYNQYAFTGNLIKQRDDLAFPVKFKTITEDLSELNSDYQILDDKIYIGQYQDFYANNEIGVFVTPPDDSFKRTFNERYAINEFEFKYKTFEQDREEENTIDAIHTENQRLLSNKQVENTKTIDVSLIRDAYKIESTRKLGLKATTSTSDDDKMFVIDVVNLSPTARGGFSDLLTQNIDENGNLQILSTDLFRWDLLGVIVGSEFVILSGENTGTYTILEITESIILLSGSPTFSGETFTQVDYPYAGVGLVNRTDEGLEYFENLINGDDFSNLKYSIRRNIKTWETYLATASKFKPDGNIKTTYFKDNGLCITRFDDETENVQEDEDILNSDLPNPILEPYLYETRLLAPFTEMKSLIDNTNVINSDNSIGGFIRCIDNNNKVIRLYSAKLDYIPSTETLSLTGEQKYDGEGVDIVISGGIVTVNEVGYDIYGLDDPFYEFDGDYLIIYDTNKLPIISPTKYDEVTVNGVIFDSAVNLMEYLVNN